MNEKIKEIAEKLNIRFGYHPEHPTIDTAVIIPSELIMFAEMIVKECADIAKHNVMNISTYADADFIQKQIEKHFGFQE